MINKQYLEYKTWADETLYQYLSQFSEEFFVKETPIVFKSILGVLNHVYQIDRIWLNHIQQQHNEFTSKLPESFYSFNELTSMQRDSNKELLELYGSFNESELKLLIDFKFINGEKGSMKREAMMMHLVNHATYHRGHIASMLYFLGEQPPTTDLPVFIGE